MKEGWLIKKLGDVLDVLRNGVNCKQDKKGVGDKISRIESISNADFDIDKVGFATLSKSDKEKYRLAKGDILFSHINSPIHVGKTALFNSDEEVYHGVNLLLMRPKPFLNGSYFEHFLKYLFQNGYWKGLCKQSVNQASVNQQDINKVEINYPQSLPEQQRIVAILDEAFAAIAKAKANAEQNLKNAKELFESYLQGVFENPKDNWEVCNLETYIKLIDYRGRTPVKTESGVRLITAKNVKLGYLQLEPQEFIANNNYESWMSRGIPNFGDVIFTTEAPLANVAQIDTLDNVAFAQRIIVMQPKPSKLNQTFLKYMLLSNPIRNKILDKGTGATVLGIKSSLLKKIEIYFPSSINEQQKIVEKLDVLSIETKKLEAIYNQKLKDLEELKKSVLQKAFNGELKTAKEVTV
jgi:type I restriction enzyme S subunit